MQKQPTNPILHQDKQDTYAPMHNSLQILRKHQKILQENKSDFFYCCSYKKHFYNKISHLKVSKGPSCEEKQR